MVYECGCVNPTNMSIHKRDLKRDEEFVQGEMFCEAASSSSFSSIELMRSWKSIRISPVDVSSTEMAPICSFCIYSSPTSRFQYLKSAEATGAGRQLRKLRHALILQNHLREREIHSLHVRTHLGKLGIQPLPTRSTATSKPTSPLSA